MNSYQIKKERERILFSTSLVLGSVILVILISFIFNLFSFEEFDEYTGPVKITFGTEDGLVDDLIKAKEIIKEEPLPQVKEVEPIIEPLPETIKEEVPIIEPTIKEKPKVDIKPEPVKAPTPVKKSEPVEPVKPLPIVQKGQENGNSHETTFESSSSKIGRRAYFPISQFMPLPKTISSDLFIFITGDITGMDEEGYNRNFFLRYYSKSGNSYLLNELVSFQNRPELWGILETAGYNINKPEYKTNRNLRSVIISFEINNNSNGKNAIRSAEIKTSSGDPEIDEAVLYGFKQSTYSNSTSEKVKGRFKYAFN